MHEVSVSLALLEQVASVVRRHGARAASKLTLRIGPLSGIDAALLRAAYGQARADTVAAEANLVIVHMPVRVLCLACAAQEDGTANRLACPACGSTDTRLIAGDEMLLESVELVF